MNSTDIFEAIVTDYYELLYRFALTLTRTKSDACDLTQHTFYVWANKGYQMRDPAKVKTWLFTTLYRAFLAARRRQLRFPHSVLTPGDAEAMPADSPTPDLQADVNQVLPALAKVDDIYQAAVALYYLNDCSYNEIAAVLEVPVGTVKSRIARGITQLREILNGNELHVKSLEWDSSAVPAAEPVQTKQSHHQCLCLAVSEHACRKNCEPKPPRLLDHQPRRKRPMLLSGLRFE